MKLKIELEIELVLTQDPFDLSEYRFYFLWIPKKCQRVQKRVKTYNYDLLRFDKFLLSGSEVIFDELLKIINGLK